MCRPFDRVRTAIAAYPTAASREPIQTHNRQHDCKGQILIGSNDIDVRTIPVGIGKSACTV